MGGRNSEYKRGLWTKEEDRLLMDYIKVHGKGKWNRVAKETGLKRCGKSCRLRWINYLCPNVKRGDFSDEENDLIIRLHKLLGNRWSLIAGRVPGRTDNQVKNHWNTHLSKQLGVNKEKRKINRLSSIVSREIGGSLMNSNSNSPPSAVCNNEPNSENVKEINMSLESAIGLVDTQKPASSHCCEQNSCWFFNNDLNPFTPNWMELVDEPLDLLWQG